MSCQLLPSSAWPSAQYWLSPTPCPQPEPTIIHSFGAAFAGVEIALVEIREKIVVAIMKLRL